MTTSQSNKLVKADRQNAASAAPSAESGSWKSLPAALRVSRSPSLDTFKDLTDDQRAQHRMQIGVRAEAILSQFWRDEATSDAVRALEIEGWMDVLELTTHAEIRAAWAEYQRSGPRGRSGALYRPDPGAIHRIIIKSRQRERMKQQRQAPEPTDKPKERVTPERAAEIRAEAGFPPLPGYQGFKPKRFGNHT